MNRNYIIAIVVILILGIGIIWLANWSTYQTPAPSTTGTDNTATVYTAPSQNDALGTDTTNTNVPADNGGQSPY